MPVDEQIMSALVPERLNFPERPVVEEIQADFYVDTSGEDSLEIWVILSDETRDEDLTGENVMQIKSVIADSLLEHGVTLFPYIRMMPRSEYCELKGVE